MSVKNLAAKVFAKRIHAGVVMRGKKFYEKYLPKGFMHLLKNGLIIQ